MSQGYHAILPGDRGYETLLAQHRHQKGGVVVYGRMSWRAVRDNDVVKFILVGGASDFPAEYEQSSARSLATEPPAPVEEKPKKKKVAKDQAASEPSTDSDEEDATSEK